jgi:uncharacterized protein
MLKKIEQYIRGLSSTVELLLVFILAFGSFFVYSFSSLLSQNHKVVFTEGHFLFFLTYESVVLSILGWFLRKRAWNLIQLGLTPNWKSTATGFILAILANAIFILIWILLSPLFSDATSQSKAISSVHLNPLLIVVFSIVNGFFEEIFVAGYIIHFFKKFQSAWIAVLISTAIRTLYHVYEPIITLIFITFMGLMFGFYYVKTNKLWALATAHIILDIYGLSMLSNALH